MTNFAPSVEWLWNHRDMELAFSVSVLTEEHRKNDDSIPSPAMNLLEAHEVFRLLEARGLVYPFSDVKGVYYINKVEWHKWDELIRELKKPRWKHSPVYKSAVNTVWIIIAALAGGFIGCYTNALGGKGAELTMKVIENYSADKTSHNAPDSAAETDEREKEKGAKTEGTKD